MDEFSLIEAIKQKQKTYKQASLQRGIGDDTAVFREAAGELAIAVDTFVEGVHFTEKTTDLFRLGYRALAANFSDLAAMGALPMYYLVSIVVPNRMEKSKLSEIFNGMKHLADRYNADLIGGDTVSGNELVLSVTVIGQIEQGKARYRNLAEVDDIVFVTGTLGDSQAGLYILQHDLESVHRQYFINRHQLPVPRIAFASSLGSIKRLALNDISDGLGNEAYEIAEASHVSIILDDKKIPVHPGLAAFPMGLQEKWKYFGGEDFELVGTVAKKDWQTVQQAAEKLNLQVTEIGHVINKDEHAVYLKKNGNMTKLQKEGYTHLK